jgi:hypothetical protein
MLNTKTTQMEIQNLIIEVTRKCNIKCDHCLRGEPINSNLKQEYIDSLLDQVTYINHVTFTGGEPSLNVPIMDYFLTEVKQRGIGISCFYIATNGINIPESFILFCLKMYSYCEDKESCSVDVSNDEFHSYEGSYNDELLRGLSFFRKRWDKDGFNYYGGSSLIKEGRSTQGRKPFTHSIDGVDSFEESEIYLNCKGEIINGCDWSYKNQKKYKLCNVGELTEFYERLLKLEESEVN